MPKRKHFHKEIYVVVRKEERRAPEFMIADEDPSGFEDGEHVGVYKLVDIRVKRVAHSLGKK